MVVWDKFRETAAAIGAANALLYALSRLVEAVFGSRVRIVKYYFTVQPVAASAGGRWSRTGTFRLFFAEPTCPQLAEAERPADVISSRFAQGARCLVAVKDDGLAGFLWYVAGPYEEDEVAARFVPAPPGIAAWDFDVMVASHFRMGRLFSYLWSRAMTELAATGITHTVSRISAFNAASLASHRRLGARVVGSAAFVCIGPLQLMRSTIAPRWHICWGRRRRPTLVIAPN